MRTTPDERPYALLMSRADGAEIEVHPDLFDALKVMVGNGYRCDGQVLIRVVGGQMMDVQVTGPAKILRHLNGKH